VVLFVIAGFSRKRLIPGARGTSPTAVCPKWMTRAHGAERPVR